MGYWAKLKDKFLHGKGIFMFFRSVLTSQLSSYVDFGVSFLFYAVNIFGPGLSAAMGAIAGGIVNCMVNYKFTFRMRECSYFAIGVKFFLIWLGSLLLNSFGTEWLDIALRRSNLFELWGVSKDMIFIVARLSTAIIVSVCWNFLLQRYFVFKSTRFDNLIDRIYYYCHANMAKRKD